VLVLLGGCGDARHFFATLLGAADCPKPAAFRLRAVLNDHVPEAVARAYVLLALLDRAADALPDKGSARIDYDKLPEATTRAIVTFWHVYQAAQLTKPVKAELDDVLAQGAAASQPQVAVVQCTPGTWAQVRKCLEGWRRHKMTSQEELAQAKRSEAAQHAHHVMMGTPDAVKVTQCAS
jgi:Domain of unknown function (DUF4470)